MDNILVLNKLAKVGISKLNQRQYAVVDEANANNAKAVILRSYALHNFHIPDSIEAIGRAGAGVNNIPVSALTAQGIPVFNTPGANANAVKELVLAGMLLACRNLCIGWQFTRTLKGDDKAIHQLVEKEKKSFAGFELPGKTLGVIGLGAIGVQVANAAVALGMKVIGFDPHLTIENAWQLSSQVAKASSIEAVLQHADILTLHVPLNPNTANLLNQERLRLMRQHAIVMNFSRAGIVDDDAVCTQLDNDALKAYVSDFPTAQLVEHRKVITLPHLGASTAEAEENCASMIVDHVLDFLEHGNIKHSVNFPNVSTQERNNHRLAIANQNIPNMVSQITQVLAQRDLNIIDMVNKSRDDIAYNLIDLNRSVSPDTLQALQQIPGILRIRYLANSNEQ